MNLLNIKSISTATRAAIIFLVCLSVQRTSANARPFVLDSENLKKVTKVLVISHWLKARNKAIGQSATDERRRRVLMYLMWPDHDPADYPPYPDPDNAADPAMNTDSIDAMLGELGTSYDGDNANNEGDTK